MGRSSRRSERTTEPELSINRPAEIKELDLIEVEWVDICTNSPWSDSLTSPAEIITVGYLLGVLDRDNPYLLITMGTAIRDWTLFNQVAIPLGVIKRIRRLRKGSRWEKILPILKNANIGIS